MKGEINPGNKEMLSKTAITFIPKPHKTLNPVFIQEFLLDEDLELL